MTSCGRFWGGIEGVQEKKIRIKAVQECGSMWVLFRKHKREKGEGPEKTRLFDPTKQNRVRFEKEKGCFSSKKACLEVVRGRIHGNTCKALRGHFRNR